LHLRRSGMDRVGARLRGAGSLLVALPLALPRTTVAGRRPTAPYSSGLLAAPYRAAKTGAVGGGLEAISTTAEVGWSEDHGRALGSFCSL
ncbi:MAG: hypothetical protein ACRDK2_10310, partial [Solirubrobacteraceae bacterium]